MINQRYRLIDTQNIRIDFIDEDISKNDLLVRPLYMSICAADQRYYQGLRPKEIMEKKLPLTLIHEAVGEIIYDPKHQLSIGTRVVMVPNVVNEKNNEIKDNYLRSSKFMSSSQDGFMQGVVVIDRNNIVEIGNLDLRIASLLELTSVAINAIDIFKQDKHTTAKTIGLWGGGSVGFITALALKFTLPDSKLIVFGKNENKLNYFTFADEVYTVDNYPKNLKINHGFECVGGLHSSDAINQIIDVIEPQGTISLLGVSEHPIPINTRMVLEKGLMLIGHSRSNKKDFTQAVQLLHDNPDMVEYLNYIISDEIVIFYRFR